MFSKWFSVVALVLVACQNAGPPDHPLQCEPEEQVNKVCGECALEFRLDDPSPELEAFANCYEDVDSGSLEGDGTLCAFNNPVGAKEWKQLVADVCRKCNEECCYLCSSEWGVLKP